MLKISRKDGPGNESVLRLEGTLGGAWVGELRTACDELLHEERRASLDLSGVVFVDRDGTLLLEALQANPRVAIVAASAFVAELLKGGAA